MDNKKISLFLLITFFSLTFLKGQVSDTCHQVVLYLVDKKGIETGVIDSSKGCVKPCKGSYTIPIDKTFLGKRETYYDDCSGKWLRIEYYFLGILTRTRRNPIFNDIN